MKIYALLIAVFALWGGGMVAMKFTYASFSIVQIVLARVGIAAVFYLLIHKTWYPLPYKRGDWKFLLALVLFEPCLLFAFETSALLYTSASQGGIIAACFPICAAVAGWLFLGEKMSKRVIFGMILSVCGVAGFSWCAVSSESASNPLLGNALMFGAVLSSTGYAVSARHISQRYSFLAVSAIQAIGGTLAFLPFQFFAPFPIQMEPAALGALLYMGVGVGILAYLGFNYSLQHLPAGIVALFASLIPVFTLIFAFLILGERLNSTQTFWILVTLAGIIWAALPAKGLRP